MAATLDAMPNGELCSDCFTNRVRIIQKSTYSVYNTVPWYQRALEAIQTRCSLQVASTEAPAPLIGMPVAAPFYVSGNYYTIKQGDTCNAIALAKSVSSADVFYAATAVGAAPRGCAGLLTGETICLPLSCTTYTLRDTNTCFSASVNANVINIAVYNS